MQRARLLADEPGPTDMSRRVAEQGASPTRPRGPD